MADETTNTTGDTVQTGEAEAVNTESSTPSQEEAVTQGQQTTEAQQQEAKPEEAKAETDAEEKKESGADRGLLKGSEEDGVPESYEDFDLGDGVTEDDQNALKELAKEHKLSQEEAQKAAAYSRSVVEQISKSIEESEAQAVEEFRAENKKVWESQPDHAQKTLLADKAVRHLGNDVENYLAESGHLYDAKMLGILAEFGKLISEPSHVTGTDTAPQGSGRIYSNSPELYNS